jgi:PAS domain S-box-containing protein
MKDTEKTKEQLIEELGELRQRDVGREAVEKRQQILSQVRDEIWKMRRARDIETVLETIREGIKMLGVSFQYCGVNTPKDTDPNRTNFSSWDSKTDRNSRKKNRNLKSGDAGTEAVDNLLRQMWEAGEVVYRQDLHRKDVFQEKQRLEYLFGLPIRSVLDIPFSYGTLAVNSTEPNAFSDENIRDLQALAGVLTEGFQRLEDIQKLEQRNQELEEEITERKQIEEAIRLQDTIREAESQIRLKIAGIEDPEDLRDVVVEIKSQLIALGVSYAHCTIQIVNDEGTDYIWIGDESPIWDRLAKTSDRVLSFNHTVNAERVPWILDTWRSGKSNYQPCVPKGYGMLSGKSVLDVPFSHGTLGIHAEEPEAFSEDDIALLERFAGVLSDGFQRFLDITEREQAEEALKGSKGRYRNLVEQLPIGIAHTTPDGKVLYQNPYAQNMWGYSIEELSELNAKDFYVHPEDRRELIKNLEERGEHFFEYQLRRKDGHVFWGKGKTTISQDARGNVVYQGILEEITERKQAEEALLESEERYRNFVTNASEGIYRIDFTRSIPVDVPDEELVATLSKHAIVGEVNEALARMYKLRPEDMVGRLATDFAPEYGERAQLVVRAPQHQMSDVETRDVDKDGQSLYLSESFSAVVEDGILIRIWGMQRDITQRKQAEEALRESETKNRAILEAQPDLMFQLSEEGVHMDFYAPSPDKLYLDPKEFLGKRVDEILPPTVGKEYRYHIRETLRTSQMQAFEYQLRFPEGSRYYDCRMVLSGENEVLAIVREITERKQAGKEKTIALALQRVRNEILQMESEADWETVGACVYTELGALVQFNKCNINIVDRAARSYHNYRIGSEGTYSDQVFPMVPTIERAVESGTPVYRFNRGQIEQFGDFAKPQTRSILDVPFKSGTLAINSEEEDAFDEADIDILSQFAQLLSEGYGRLEEIINRQRMEEELRRAHNLESLGVLAGGIAHDFNNVLTGVMGNLALLLLFLDKDSEEYEIASEAKQSADRTKDLTQQLMTFSKGGAPVKETASIEELIRETTGLSLHGANTRPEFHFADDLSSVDIDTGQIGQVIQNLVINADQAMPNGGTLKISAENVEVSDEDPLSLETGTYIKISVEDQGIGIHEDLLSQVFDPYFSTKETGHGLGLSITYSIIQRHSGHITISSRQNVGTTFEFYLPASEEQAITVTETEQYLARGTGRILLMDDEETIHRMVGRTLKGLGYDVESVYDGDEAIQIYKAVLESEAPFDIVIMDLTIPGGMGGKKAVNKLREIDPHARVIVSSGYANDPVMANFAEYGFAGRVVKPVDIEELADTVKRVLANRE